MYGRREFLEDAALAGKVLYAQQGPTGIFSSRGCLPALDTKYYPCFTNELFAYIQLDAPRRLYRFFGGLAGKEGGWWTAHYPYQEIHGGLPSWYAPWSREGLGVKQKWSTMADLVRAEWLVGSRLFYGRAAIQCDHGKVLHGGYLQYFCQGPLPALKMIPIEQKG